MAIGLLFGWIVFGFLTAKKPTLEAALEAINAAPLVIDNDPRGRWHKTYPGSTRVKNEHISLVYWEIKNVASLAETIDLVISGIRGGIIMTFENQELIVWTRNGIAVDNYRSLRQHQGQANLVRYQVRRAIARGLD